MWLVVFVGSRVRLVALNCASPRSGMGVYAACPRFTRGVFIGSDMGTQHDRSFVHFGGFGGGCLISCVAWSLVQMWIGASSRGQLLVSKGASLCSNPKTQMSKNATRGCKIPVPLRWMVLSWSRRRVKLRWRLRASGLAGSNLPTTPIRLITPSTIKRMVMGRPSLIVTHARWDSMCGGKEDAWFHQWVPPDDTGSDTY